MAQIRSISCAHDKALVHKLYDFLLSRPEIRQDYEEISKNDPFISYPAQHLTLIEDEILVNEKSTLTVEAAGEMINAFVTSNLDYLKGYQIIESVDVLILSKVLSPAETDGELLVCQFCVYFTHYWDDLFNHRKTHAVSPKG